MRISVMKDSKTKTTLGIYEGCILAPEFPIDFKITHSIFSSHWKKVAKNPPLNYHLISNDKLNGVSKYAKTRIN